MLFAISQNFLNNILAFVNMLVSLIENSPNVLGEIEVCT
jgi:hypothetical protein